MDRDTLLLGLAAVFAGIAALMGVLAFTDSLFLLLVSLPFGVTAYLMWEHATGRLARRLREREAGRRTTADAEAGPGASRSRLGREARRRAEAGRRARGGRRAGGTANARAGPGDTRGSPAAGTGMPVREAYRELGLSPGASRGDVKRAYRERVKETHPDSGGDEEAFKRVNRAYDALRDD
ncbi:J domain-containing protein [Halorarum salinum]|uniref:J domain-containing protein n=1 Tax=Halorarum salinum TaxID=2743089 RepID=A0A7D5LCH6_9EURY|nr:J domain-containing protein [Halobaculum salinum]QLG63370.1 J domain-containing protein [Halobaculum salinum]